MRGLNRVLVGVVILLALAAAFSFGAATVKPEPRYVPYEVEVVREVKTIVEVIREVEVEKPIQWREFSSVEELEVWLAEDNTDAIYLVSGRYPGDGVFIDPDYDCDNYAEDLMLSALRDGYLIPQDLDGAHVRNFTYIGNEIWIIEPQSDGVLLYKYSRD